MANRRVLLLAGDTDGNLGDLAIATATCRTLRELDPEISITMPSAQPDRDERLLGIESIRRGVRGFSDLIAAARNSDIVICGGGGLFQDDDSLVKMPYWALRLVLVRLFCNGISGLSIGAGPLDYRISRLFARLALRQLAPVSVRDDLALSVLQPLTRQPIDVVPDPAFLLDPAPAKNAKHILEEAGISEKKRPLVGVSVRRWFHKYSSIVPYKYASRLGLQKERGKKEMSVVVKRLATALDDVVECTGGHVVFLPTYNVTHEADIRICRQVAARMDPDRSTVLEINDPRLYKAVAGRISVMLCGRMHAGILAAGQGTPIVGLAYNPKFFGMFSLIGQENRCFKISDLLEKGSSERLTKMLKDAIEKPDKYRPTTSGVERQTRSFIEKIVASTTVAR